MKVKARGMRCRFCRGVMESLGEGRGQGKISFERMHLIPILPLYLIAFILHNRK